MSSLLSETFGYLLVSIERQFEQPNMMPHSVSFDDAIKFFGKNHLIQHTQCAKDCDPLQYGKQGRINHKAD
jgi:hypothetical protein